MEGQAIEIHCADGVRLAGHLWSCRDAAAAVVIINPATGIAARFYHAYARFLAAHGFHVVTYDYRGIGRSKPATLKGYDVRWSDWGERDFDAVLGFVQDLHPGHVTLVVGHSIGGFLPGYALRAPIISRMLTVGAQFAYWPDYRAPIRLRFALKWHVVMPTLSLAFGYFPGERLGWLEDLPKGVALDWASRGSRIERGYAPQDAEALLLRFANVQADILAVSVTDDDFATPTAMRRALSYYKGAEAQKVMLRPQDLENTEIGHFDLFRARHANGFWLDSLLWLRDGINPWPLRRFD